MANSPSTASKKLSLRSAPRLVVDIGPSYRTLGISLIIHLLTLAAVWHGLVLHQQIEWGQVFWVHVFAAGTVGLVLFSQTRDFIKLTRKQSFIWHSDNLIELADAPCSRYTLTDGSYNSRLVVVLKLRLHTARSGDTQLRQKRLPSHLTLVIAKDSLPREQFSHLRLWMRALGRYTR